MGASDGAADVGRGDGAADGDAEGGAVDGAGVGAWRNVGAGAGTAVGAPRGADVGAAVGDGAGTTDGAEEAVGASEELGGVVGVGVSADDGPSVGDGQGAGVGHVPQVRGHASGAATPSPSTTESRQSRAGFFANAAQPIFVLRPRCESKRNQASSSAHGVGATEDVGADETGAAVGAAVGGLTHVGRGDGAGAGQVPHVFGQASGAVVPSASTTASTHRRCGLLFSASQPIRVTRPWK